MPEEQTISSGADATASLRRLREEARLSQRAFAESLSIEQSQLSRIEAAKDIKMSTFVALADRLGYEVRLAPKTTTSPSGRNGGRLAELVARAIAEHMATAFWNTPTDLALPDMARIAVSRLRKYGGKSGWLLAAEIARELEVVDAH